MQTQMNMQTQTKSLLPIRWIIFQGPEKGLGSTLHADTPMEPMVPGLLSLPASLSPAPVSWEQKLHVQTPDSGSVFWTGARDPGQDKHPT